MLFLLKSFRSVEEYKKGIKRVLITEQEIEEGVRRAAAYVDGIYDGAPILLVCILKGGVIFASDLCKAVSVPCELGFMRTKSYFDSTSPVCSVSITLDLDYDIRGYHVVVVEDIIDTGCTLHEVLAMLKVRAPLSLRVITLLDKPSRRVVDFSADMALFTIPDLFAVGYGLDYGEYYRNLPYIAELDPDLTESA